MSERRAKIVELYCRRATEVGRRNVAEYDAGRLKKLVREAELAIGGGAKLTRAEAADIANQFRGGFDWYSESDRAAREREHVFQYRPSAAKAPPKRKAPRRAGRG